MSLLTKEQQEEVARLRNDLIDLDPEDGSDGDWAKSHAFDLLRIIDDIQARAPKQYTEQELRENYENCLSAETGEDNTWDGWIECAKFLGALKAEP